MKIRAIHVRRFRSIAAASLDHCGGLNVLIGKNNAGKSNLLNAIELVLRHLQRGIVAGTWPTGRPRDEFTDRTTSKRVQIGVEFELPSALISQLQLKLQAEAPHLDKAIQQISAHTTVAVVIAGVATPSSGYLFVEHLAAGTIDASTGDLSVSGMSLLSVSELAAAELHAIHQTAADLREEEDILRQVLSNRRALDMSFSEGGYRPFFLAESRRASPRPDVFRRLEAGISRLTAVEEAIAVLNDMLAATREKIENTIKRQTTGSIGTFAGEAKSSPAYAEWLLTQLGSIPLIHFRENKQRIGREEADTLLQLKVRRGGPERLGAIQETIRSLLGVHVDAFQAEDRDTRFAEMDVDQFLVEANGAGIREALRIILDLELKNPKLVLIEEPEVHLHPGLARVLAEYLRQKAETIQMFVTTHSTEFVDSVTFQNAYLVSRDASQRTVTQLVTADEGALRIPAELGLRLSTVFMFDRLLFVEGSSDEAVLRQIASKLGIDLTQKNVGFVHMGGVRNFAHYAAEATLDLLARRQIKMVFVTDRDERDDEEVNRMVARLGARASLKVLDRRELENYLLDRSTVARFIAKKLELGGRNRPHPDADMVDHAISEAVRSLEPEVVRLRLEKQMLCPVFLNTRTARGSIKERLEAAANSLATKSREVEEVRDGIAREVHEEWANQGEMLAPGTLILENVARIFDTAFSKEKGDSEKLAELLPEQSIPPEIPNLIRAIVSG